MSRFATAWRPSRAEDAKDHGRLCSTAVTVGGATSFLACTAIKIVSCLPFPVQTCECNASAAGVYLFLGLALFLTRTYRCSVSRSCLAHLVGFIIF